jgi:hypothetical protein
MEKSQENELKPGHVQIELFVSELSQLMKKHGIKEIEQGSPEITILQAEFDGLRFEMNDGNYEVSNNIIYKNVGYEGEFPNKRVKYEKIKKIEL